LSNLPGRHDAYCLRYPAGSTEPCQRPAAGCTKQHPAAPAQTS